MGEGLRKFQPLFLGICKDATVKVFTLPVASILLGDDKGEGDALELEVLRYTVGLSSKLELGPLGSYLLQNDLNEGSLIGEHFIDRQSGGIPRW